jgi:hypothetical protein
VCTAHLLRQRDGPAHRRQCLLCAAAAAGDPWAASPFASVRCGKLRHGIAARAYWVVRLRCDATLHAERSPGCAGASVRSCARACERTCVHVRAHASARAKTRPRPTQRGACMRELWAGMAQCHRTARCAPRPRAAK